MVIWMNGHGADFRHVVPKYMQTAAGDDFSTGRLIDNHRIVADVLKKVLGATRQHHVIRGKAVYQPRAEEFSGRSHFLTFIFGQGIGIHLCQYLSSCNRLADTIHGNIKLG